MGTRWVISKKGQVNRRHDVYVVVQILAINGAGPKIWHALPDWQMNGAIVGITSTTRRGLGWTELTVGNDLGGELPSAPAHNNGLLGLPQARPVQASTQRFADNVVASVREMCIACCWRKDLYRRMMAEELSIPMVGKSRFLPACSLSHVHEARAEDACS